MTTTGDRLRQVAARARASWAQAATDRAERNALMLQMDAEEAKLREIAEEAGMSIGHVHRIIVRPRVVPKQREAPHE